MSTIAALISLAAVAGLAVLLLADYRVLARRSVEPGGEVLPPKGQAARRAA
jgi:hypothetical protein